MSDRLHILNKRYAPKMARIISRFSPVVVPRIDCGPGWSQVLIDLDQQISKYLPDYEIYQIKDNSGQLSFSWHCGPDPFARSYYPCSDRELASYHQRHLSWSESKRGQREMERFAAAVASSRALVIASEREAAKLCSWCGQSRLFAGPCASCQPEIMA